MTKLIIDPCLFEVPEDMSQTDQIEHFMILKNSIDFVSDFFQVSLDEYDGAPYSYNSEGPPFHPPLTRGLTVRNRYSEISKKIQKMLSTDSWIDIQDESIDGCSLEFDEGMITEQKFKRYLYSIISSAPHEEYVLLLAQKNKERCPQITVSINDSAYRFPAIYNPAEDCNGIVHKYLKSSTDINGIFPQSAACHKLNIKFLEIVSNSDLNVNEKRPIYISFGTEVASRNDYECKPDISKKNPSYEVFVHNQRKYYLSIDVEHGALKVFRNSSKNPPHIGEYNFSCEFIKEAEPQTHKLII